MQRKTHFVASSFRDPRGAWLFWLWFAKADLIQEGNIGLMKAVKRFNP